MPRNSEIARKGESRLGLSNRDHHEPRAEAVPNPVPVISGRETDHFPRVYPLGFVGLTIVPSQDGDRGGHITGDSHPTPATPVKVRKARAVRGAVGRLNDDLRENLAGGATFHPALPEGETDHMIAVTLPYGVSLATQFGGNAEDLACHKTPGPHRGRAGEVTCSEIGSDAEGRVGHRSRDCHTRFADAATEIPSNGEGGVSHDMSVSHISNADPATIAEIREQWRRRQAWHRAEKSLTLQAKALCRRLATDGDKDEADVIYKAAMGEGTHPMAAVALAAVFPLTEARDGVERHRKAVESRLRKLAKTLPVAPWVQEIPGASLNSLAAIVGEAGDLSAYANPAKVWKRMGLAVMPDGTRQRRVGGADALDHGYSPARRSVVWNIGGSLIGGMGRGPRLEPNEDAEGRDDLSPLQKVFVRRIRYEAERDPSHARPLTKAGKESFSKHAANRAKRYVEKRFLRDLWSAWRREPQDGIKVA